MLGEVTLAVLLVVGGYIAYRETVCLRRWDPAFFRRGVLLFRASQALDETPELVPEPKVPAPWFRSRSSLHRLTPTEVAFTAEVSMSPLFKALLAFDPQSHSLVVTGRLFWGASPLFLLGGAVLAAFGEPVGVGIVVVVVVLGVSDYISESRRLRNVLNVAAHDLHGSGAPGRRTMQ